jgi:hypothetical protein
MFVICRKENVSDEQYLNVTFANWEDEPELATLFYTFEYAYGISALINGSYIRKVEMRLSHSEIVPRR